MPDLEFQKTLEKLQEAQKEYDELVKTKRAQDFAKQKEAEAEQARQAALAQQEKEELEKITADFNPLQTAIDAKEVAISTMLSHIDKPDQEKDFRATAHTYVKEVYVKLRTAFGSIKLKPTTNSSVTNETLSKADEALVQYQEAIQRVNELDDIMQLQLGPIGNAYKREDVARTDLQNVQEVAQKLETDYIEIGKMLEAARVNLTEASEQLEDAEKALDDIVKSTKQKQQDVHKKTLEIKSQIKAGKYHSEKSNLKLVFHIEQLAMAQVHQEEAFEEVRKLESTEIAERKRLEEIRETIKTASANFASTDMSHNPASDYQSVNQNITATQELFEASVEEWQQVLDTKNDEQKAINKLEQSRRHHKGAEQLQPYQSSEVQNVLHPDPVILDIYIEEAQAKLTAAQKNHSLHIKASKIVELEVIDLLEQYKAKNKKYAGKDSSISVAQQQIRELKCEKFTFVGYKNAVKNIILNNQNIPAILKNKAERDFSKYDEIDNTNQEVLVVDYNRRMRDKIQTNIADLKDRKAKYKDNDDYQRAADIIIWSMEAKLHDFDPNSAPLTSKPGPNLIKQAKDILSAHRGWTKPETTYSMGIFKSYQDTLDKLDVTNKITNSDPSPVSK
jgi:hypothetical protein